MCLARHGPDVTRTLCPHSVCFPRSSAWEPIAKDTAAGPLLGASMGESSLFCGEGGLRGPLRDEATQGGVQGFEAPARPPSPVPRPAKVAKMLRHLAFRLPFRFFVSEGRRERTGERQVAVSGAMLPSRGTGPPVASLADPVLSLPGEEWQGRTVGNKGPARAPGNQELRQRRGRRCDPRP